MRDSYYSSKLNFEFNFKLHSTKQLTFKNEDGRKLDQHIGLCHAENLYY